MFLYPRVPAASNPDLEQAREDAAVSKERAQKDLRDQRAKLIRERRTVMVPLRRTIEMNHLAELAIAALKENDANPKY